MSFAWSFSKLKSYETCPKRHYEVDVVKNFKEEPSEQLDWGDRVHKAFHEALGKGKPLPGEMAPYQKWVDQLRGGNGKLLVEQKYAITKDFAPCAYFAPVVWLRIICDALKIDGPVAVAKDWKTGAVKPESIQLFLTAQALFSHYPALQRVQTEFVWLQFDTVTTAVYDRADMAEEWVQILPRVEAMEGAGVTLSYPPKPSGLCKKYCPVKSCPYWGKGGR